MTTALTIAGTVAAYRAALALLNMARPETLAGRLASILGGGGPKPVK